MDMPHSTEVVICGGGPAGMMAGMLFARAGVKTLVLEKHADFFRDFRGDTVHPSTMEILSELGMLERFLARPHNRIDHAEIVWNGTEYKIGDLSHLATPAPFIAMMPQWDFLDFLREEAKAFPKFALVMAQPVSGLVEDDGRIAGVTLADGCAVMAQKLVIMADGRDSLVRRQELLPLENIGAPIDVFWFRVPKTGRANALRGVIRGNAMLVLIDRDEYWQSAYVLPKGKADDVRAEGMARFRDRIAETAPDLGNLHKALPDWDSVKLLSVSLDRLRCWHRPGLLAIGDAAHAMSPVGGIGINLAIQDAVAAANYLAEPIAAGQIPDSLLHKVENRRLLPTRIIQAGQKAAHEQLLAPVLTSDGEEREPLFAVKVLDRCAILQRLPARVIGLGFRREHLNAPLNP